MNNELELSEQLENEGYTPFDIDELTKESILDEKIFEYIFGIDGDLNRENVIIKLQIKAKDLKITRQFNTKLKLYKEMYIKQLKAIDNNETEFEDCPYGNFKCGKWVANNMEIYKKEYNNNMQIIRIKASPIPIIPVERLINIDTNTEKIKLAFQKDGRWQEIIVEKNTIVSKNKILQLANRGIEVNEDNAKNLITYLSDILELNSIPMKKGVSHLGWVDNEFIPYSDKYTLDVDFEFNQKIKCIKEHGDYKKWKEYIKGLRSKSIPLRILIASSFASVLVKEFKLNTFIIHLWGKSGNGKTVAEMICASIWGNPNDNLISNLSNTAIANERLLDFFRNMPVFFDELQIAKLKFKSFDEMIYMLVEGKGKERGNVDNGIRKQTIWQTIAILNGEEPITNDVSKEGVKNRVIEINEDNPIIENGNETVKLIQENYGFAGKEFIGLIKDKEKVHKIQEEYVNALNRNIKYKKQANAFSVLLTADNIISKNIFKDEPLKIEDVKQYFRNDTDEIERFYNLIMDWFYQNKGKFIENSIEIWGKYDQVGDEITNIYIIPKVLYNFLEENNISFNGIKRKFADAGYIERKSKEYTQNQRINGSICRCIKFIVKPILNDLQFEDNYTQTEMEDLPF